jgi:hypothetical protein
MEVTMFKVIYKTQLNSVVMAKSFHTQERALAHADKLIQINKTNREVHVEVVKMGVKEERLSYFYSKGN